MRLKELLWRIAKMMETLNVPYMIIGGQSVAVHGEPRFTKDVDITVGVGLERLEDILDVAKEFQLLPLPEDPKSFAHRTLVLPLKDLKSGFRVDIIFSYTPYERQAIRRAIEINGVKYASVEDTIILKMVAGRPRDIEDVKTILLRNPERDEDYILRWLEEFSGVVGEDLADKYRKIKKEVEG